MRHKSAVIRRAIDGHKLAAKLMWKQGHYDVPKANAKNPISTSFSLKIVMSGEINELWGLQETGMH